MTSTAVKTSNWKNTSILIIIAGLIILPFAILGAIANTPAAVAVAVVTFALCVLIAAVSALINNR